MEKFLALIKESVKDGVDMDQIKQAAEALNPLNTVKSKEDAWTFIKGNEILLSTLDQKVNDRVTTAKENLMSGEVKTLLKAREDEIRAELNPKETDEQKALRDLQNKLSERDKKDALRDLQDTLSTKAKELNFDPMRARDFAVFGADAESKLQEYAEFINSTVEEKVNSQVKERFTSPAPSQTKIEPKDLQQKIMEARASGNTSEALKLQIQQNQNMQQP